MYVIFLRAYNAITSTIADGEKKVGGMGVGGGGGQIYDNTVHLKTHFLFTKMG